MEVCVIEHMRCRKDVLIGEARKNLKSINERNPKGYSDLKKTCSELKTLEAEIHNALECPFTRR